MKNIKISLFFAVGCSMILSACGNNFTPVANLENSVDYNGGVNMATLFETGENGHYPLGYNIPLSGEFIFAQWSNVQTLDPHVHVDTVSADATTQIFEPLLMVNENSEIVPWLAESYEQIDPYIWEFRLRQGVYFSDGTPFNAYAVVRTLERFLDPENAFPGITDLEMITYVLEIDTYTVHIITEFPFGPLAIQFTAGRTRVISPTAIDEELNGGRTVSENPIGTGPFVLTEHVLGGDLTFVVNERYWGALPNFRYLRFINVPDSVTRLNMLESGEVNAVVVGSVDANVVEVNPNLELLRIDGARHNFIAFNNLIEPFDNLYVRRAMSYAFDIESLLVAIDGMGITSVGPVAPSVVGFSSDIVPITHDLERARHYLRLAGLENGFSASLYIGAGRPLDESLTAQIFQHNLAEIGVYVSITEVEWGAFLDRIAAQDMDMFVVGWSGGMEADSFLHANFHSSRHGTSGNLANFSNQQVDDLLDQARREIDTEARHELYRQIVQLVIDYSPYRSTFHPIIPFATNGVEYLFVRPGTSTPFFGQSRLR